MTYIVGAYAASPALHAWDPALEREYYDSLLGLSAVRGLELPWIGGLHLHDEEWLLRNLPAQWDLVLTDVAGTVRRVAADPAYGLASRDEEGRAAALADAARMRDDVHRLVDASGRASVIAVELHSAPRLDRTDSARFSQSLAEIASWDWAGSDLVVEHCDTRVPDHEPAKGWSRLEDEAAAIEGTGIGLSLNWGRSAIELRDARAVVGQVREAHASGQLRGLVFSGVAQEPTGYGAAWEDAHLPFARSDGFPLGSPDSLLTLDRVADALEAAGTLDWLGIKFGWPGREGSVEDRIAMIASGLQVLDSVVVEERTDSVR